MVQKKAETYAATLPYTSLCDVRPLVVFAVPSERRAKTTTAAVANSGAPIAVVVWSASCGTPALRLVTAAYDEKVGDKSVPLAGSI